MSSPEKITADDLLDAMAEANVLETFLHLPTEDQANFSRWIGTARDDGSHWRRIEALVLALRTGLLDEAVLADRKHERDTPQ